MSEPRTIYLLPYPDRYGADTFTENENRIESQHIDKAQYLALPADEFRALQARAEKAVALVREARGWLTDRWEGEERAFCQRLDAFLALHPAPTPPARTPPSDYDRCDLCGGMGGRHVQGKRGGIVFPCPNPAPTPRAPASGGCVCDICARGIAWRANPNGRDHGCYCEPCDRWVHPTHVNTPPREGGKEE